MTILPRAARRARSRRPSPILPELRDGLVRASTAARLAARLPRRPAWRSAGCSSPAGALAATGVLLPQSATRSSRTRVERDPARGRRRAGRPRPARLLAAARAGPGRRTAVGAAHGRRPRAGCSACRPAASSATSSGVLGQDGIARRRRALPSAAGRRPRSALAHAVPGPRRQRAGSSSAIDRHELRERRQHASGRAAVAIDRDRAQPRCPRRTSAASPTGCSARRPPA